MIQIRLKDVVNNPSLPILNELTFGLRATTEKIRPIKFATLGLNTIMVVNGNAQFYSNSTATQLIGNLFSWTGDSTNKLWVKFSTNSVIRIVSKFDLTQIGTSTTGIINEDPDQETLQFDINQLSGTTRITHAFATFTSGVTGNIESYKDNTGLVTIAIYRTAIIGDVFTAIYKSAETIKSLALRNSNCQVDLSKFQIFNLSDFYLTRNTYGDLKYVRTAELRMDAALNTGNTVIYTGNSALLAPIGVVALNSALMDDSYMINYLRDLALTNWIGNKTCAVVFRNTNNAIIDAGNVIINSSVQNSVNALKALGVIVTINGTVR